MTEPLTRPSPRWLHLWAILCAVATFLLLALGQMVTSFRAGMADPVWPTEPWYLADNYKLDFGYLIEHSHRIAGFTVGGLVIVLAIGSWWTEPRKLARWTSLVGLVVLIAGYGEFHRGLMVQRNVPPADVRLPMNAVNVTLAGLALVLAVAFWRVFARVPGAWLRLLAFAGLVAVMIQGLLGGFRVKLNELVGTDLAAVHGVFAQVVVGLLVTLVVLTARLPAVSSALSRAIREWALLLAVLVFVQIVWGAMVRHDPTPLAQRLHFITAFAATAVAIWLIRAVLTDPAARARSGLIAWTLAALLAAQLYLGVEAWMAKFGAYTLPELVPITPESAAIRTAHALVGSGLWAAALALAVRLWQPTVVQGNTLEFVESERFAPRLLPARESRELVTRFGGDAT